MATNEEGVGPGRENPRRKRESTTPEQSHPEEAMQGTPHPPTAKLRARQGTAVEGREGTALKRLVAARQGKAGQPTVTPLVPRRVNPLSPPLFAGKGAGTTDGRQVMPPQLQLATPPGAHQILKEESVMEPREAPSGGGGGGQVPTPSHLTKLS